MQARNFFLYILQKKIMRGFEPLIQADLTDSADFKIREILSSASICGSKPLLSYMQVKKFSYTSCKKNYEKV